MPARYVVQILDDPAWLDGREVPADVTVELAVTVDDGSAKPSVRKVTLYLTAEHKAELDGDLDRWFSIPEQAAQRARARGGRTHERMEYRRVEREFADLFGLRNRKNPDYPAYKTSTGGDGYYPFWLDEAFEAWIEAGSPPPGQYRAVA